MILPCALCLVTELLAIAPRYEATGWQALFVEPTWFVTLIVMAIVTVVVTVFSAWREQNALPKGRWKWLAILRLLAIVAIGYLLAGWERRPVTEQIESSRVVLLVDSSTSMGLEANADSRVNAGADGERFKDATSRSDVAVELLPQLESRFAETHEVVEARFGTTVIYRQEKNPRLKSNSDFDHSRSSFYSPRDGETRLGEALESILNDYQSLPLAAVVVLTDGRSTGGISPQRIADQYAERGVLLHTVGLGPLVEPKQVFLRGLSVPSRVYSGDPFEATVRLAAQGNFAGEVTVELLLLKESNQESALPNNGLTKDISSVNNQLNRGEVIHSEEITFTKVNPIVVKRFELESPPPGRYRLIARLIALGQSTKVAASFESVDQKTSVLLLATGPLRDYRILREQLLRENSFSVDAYLQSASPGITQDVRTILDSFPDEMDQLDKYDVVVAYDVDWEEIGEASQKFIQQWVLKKGGGLLVVKGASFADQLVEQTLDSPLGSLLPIRFLEDPLTLAIESQSRVAAIPIQLTEAGEQADFMQLDSRDQSSLEAWQQIEGFYNRPLDTELKIGATSYAFLGESSVPDSESQPILVDQYYGAGRVAYLATAEIWRLRRVNTNWFTAFYTRLLRHLARGRVQGSAAAGSLFFDRDQYQVGQTMSARLNRLVNSSFSQDEPPIVAKWFLPSGKAIATPMQPVEGQTNSYRGALPILEPGVHRIQVQLPLFETPLAASATAILPPLEIARTTRNETLLKKISEATSAIYCATTDEALKLSKQTPSQSEVRLLLGEVDKEYSSRVAGNTLWIVALLLSLEWLLRRLWRLA